MLIGSAGGMRDYSAFPDLSCRKLSRRVVKEMCPYLGSGSIRTRRITPRPSGDGGGRVVGHIYINERHNYLSKGGKPKLSFVDRRFLVDGVET